MMTIKRLVNKTITSQSYLFFLLWWEHLKLNWKGVALMCTLITKGNQNSYWTLQQSSLNNSYLKGMHLIKTKWLTEKQGRWLFHFPLLFRRSGDVIAMFSELTTMGRQTEGGLTLLRTIPTWSRKIKLF